MIRALPLVGLLFACAPSIAADGNQPSHPAPPAAKGQGVAIFASGCFWCSEYDFEQVPGVIDAVSGYAAGRTKRPTYKQVTTGSTGHTEAIRVIYDPAVVSYGDLLEHFWRTVDPFDDGGQFCDRGSQYRGAILPLDPSQRTQAQNSLRRMERVFGKKIKVKIEDPGIFWVAEDYHQDFYKKNPAHYKRYRWGCGRDQRVQTIWSQVPENRSRTLRTP